MGRHGGVLRRTLGLHRRCKQVSWPQSQGEPRAFEIFSCGLLSFWFSGEERQFQHPGSVLVPGGHRLLAHASKYKCNSCAVPARGFLGTEPVVFTCGVWKAKHIELGTMVVLQSLQC